MMELHLRRGALTEPEVRYYMKQLCLGIEYLHDQQIIHRDLKVIFKQLLASLIHNHQGPWVTNQRHFNEVKY